MPVAIFCTIVVAFVFIRMSLSYTDRRAERCYATDRTPAASIRSFRHLSKGLFVANMVIAITSYWLDSPLLLQAITVTASMKTSGAILVLLGYIGLSQTFKNLGEHYSPMFDAFLPKAIVMTGVYRYIRHPVYLFNLFVSFGLAISSGSLLVLVSALIGFGFILRSIHIEEHYLQASFPEYSVYMQRSWRLVPFFY